MHIYIYILNLDVCGIWLNDCSDKQPVIPKHADRFLQTPDFSTCNWGYFNWTLISKIILYTIWRRHGNLSILTQLVLYTCSEFSLFWLLPQWKTHVKFLNWRSSLSIQFQWCFTIQFSTFNVSTNLVFKHTLYHRKLKENLTECHSQLSSILQVCRTWMHVTVDNVQNLLYRIYVKCLWNFHVMQTCTTY
jgi:hypothetical protein